ncbi:hypothetical protein JADG_005665 [Aureobasidium aubasidani]|nr:hypothetical protein JADG_005665 [Aureobasidium pullulans]
MRNILAIICSKRVAACCGMFVCPSYICNIACKVNSASQTIFIYKHVKYLIGTLCSDAFTGKIHNIPTERITFRYHTSHPSPDAFFPYSASNNAWLIRTKNNVGIVERPLNYSRHIRLPTILWLLQRNLAIEECYKCVFQKGITPDLKAINVHDALVVKNSNNMRQICYKSPWDKEKKSYHHVGGISGHAQRTTEVAQRLYAKALYYTKYFGLDPKDFSQKNGILYFCEGFLMPENWSTSVAYAVCVDHAVRVRDV